MRNKKFIFGYLFFLLFSTCIVTNTNIKAECISTDKVLETQKTEVKTVEYFTKQQVIEDINYVMDKVGKNHVSCVNGVPEEVLKQKELEIENLSDNVSSIEEWRIICRILAKLHDAHSRIIGPDIVYMNRLPFRIAFDHNARKCFCLDGEFDGTEIISINGVKIFDIFEDFKLNFSYEIEEWAFVNFFRWRRYFVSTLARAGIDVLKPLEISFLTSSGIKTQSIELVPIETNLDQSSSFVSYKIDKDNSVGIFTLDECIFNEEYRDTVDKFFADVVSNNVKNIVVDLRYNSGGNSAVEIYFARYLQNTDNITSGKCEIRKGDKLEIIESRKFTAEDLKKFKSDKNLFDGKIFILTSNSTFSSAMLFARDFSDNNLATIVGEIPGNSPTSFGDISGHNYLTPNSKLKFYVTYKKFYRPDETKGSDELVPNVQEPSGCAIDKVYKLIKSES